jgi:spore coat polysaccharide biosynthesis predicted glycosyltransferase SpsG
METIIFRVDGGNVYSIAMGHVFRCVRLARLLAKKEINSLFIMRDYPEGLDFVKSAGFEVELLKENIPLREETEKIISRVRQLGASVFIDLRTTKKDLVNAANMNGINTIVYEDVCTEDIEPTILINPSLISFKESRYLKKKTRCLLGTDYIVFDPTLEKYRRINFSSTINNLFLCFGGADPCNISSRVLNILLCRDDNFKIVLVLGPAFNHHYEIGKILNEENKMNRVKLVENNSELAPIQSNCDAAITSGGTIAYELVAICLPTLVFPSIDYEAHNTAPLLVKGLIKGLKQDIANVYDKELIECIDDFLGNTLARKALYNASCEQRLLGGTTRIVSLIQSLMRS